MINISQKRGHINWQVKAILPEDDVILMPTFLFFHMAIDMERTPSFHYFFFLFQIFRCVRSPVHTQCACMNTYVHIHCLIIPPFRLKPTTTQTKKMQADLFKLHYLKWMTTILIYLKWIYVYIFILSKLYIPKIDSFKISQLCSEHLIKGLSIFYHLSFYVYFIRNEYLKKEEKTCKSMRWWQMVKRCKCYNIIE